MTTYRLVRVTTGFKGNGEEARTKGPNNGTPFCCLSLRYFFFFLNLDMFVCTYTSHVSLFYWSYHSSYQLFHRVTRLFWVSISPFFYYTAADVLPSSTLNCSHPFTHSPTHSPFYDDPMTIPHCWPSPLTQLHHQPSPPMPWTPGHQCVSTPPITAHHRPFPNIASITNAQEYPFQHISQPQWASLPLAGSHFIQDPQTRGLKHKRTGNKAPTCVEKGQASLPVYSTGIIY